MTQFIFIYFNLLLSWQWFVGSQTARSYRILSQDVKFRCLKIIFSALGFTTRSKQVRFKSVYLVSGNVFSLRVLENANKEVCREFCSYVYNSRSPLSGRYCALNDIVNKRRPIIIRAFVTLSLVYFILCSSTENSLLHL